MARVTRKKDNFFQLTNWFKNRGLQCKQSNERRRAGVDNQLNCLANSYLLVAIYQVKWYLN